MSRIPEAFLQDLLARTDIVDVVGTRLELKRAGREFRALSPFTAERTPSFFVSPAKQMFFDFSSGKNGNAIGFLMEYERLSFIEAVEALAQRAGIEVPRAAGVAAPVMEGPIDALAAAERFFRAQLKSAPHAIEYLKKRGISGETARRFGIGYAPDAWDALTRLFPDPAHPVTAGLLIRKEGDEKRVYDRFRNRVMFPIRDSRGRTIAFGGRTLGDDPAKYLNSPETPLFHKGRNLYGLYEARQAEPHPPSLTVVEGYMDAVMLAQHGITGVVATLGTATTPEHLRLLFRATHKVVYCFDGDRAGRAAAWRALEQTLAEMAEGRECAFMFLPEGEDPDTLVQKIGADAFRERPTTPLSTFLLTELGKQGNLATADGRARVAALALPHLRRIPPGPFRAVVVEELSRLTRVPRGDLDAMVEQRTAAPVKAVQGADPIRKALQVLLERPELAAGVGQVDELAAADVPGAALLVRVIEYFQEHPGASAGALLERLREQGEQGWVAEMAGALVAESEQALQREFSDGLDFLRDRARRQRIQQLNDLARERSLTPPELAELRALTELRAGRGQGQAQEPGV